MLRGRRGLKVSAGESKVVAVILNGDEGLECEVHVDGIRLEDVLEFRYSGVYGRFGYRWSRMWEEGYRCHQAFS